MRRKDKVSYQFEHDLWLMSPSWEIWNEWHDSTSKREKQAYFDSKIGNIYVEWQLHHSDTDKKVFQKLIDDDVFIVMDPHMLVGVDITRDFYNITILAINKGINITFRHAQTSKWHARLWLKL